MRVEYQISEADFMSAYEALWRSMKMGSTRESIWGALCICGGILFVWRGSWIGYLLGATGAILVLMVIGRRFLHRKAFRDSPKFSGPTQATFTEQSIEVISPIGESNLNWSIFQSAAETEDFFLAMMTKRSFSIIPKRAFGGEAEIEAFRTLLSSKLGEIRRFT